jgi:hypothetical protein
VNAKCDWSKVSLGKSNTCNAYKFEVTGTVDTCYKHSILIIKKGFTTPSYTGTSRVFSYTFKDTGYYFVKVSIKNSCCGGDTLFYDYMHVTCKPKPKCDWSKLGFGYGYSCNVYKFELGSLDTCISYSTYIYNFKTGRWVDTFRTRIFTKTFADTGKYKIYVIAKNKCGGCDTAYYNFVTVTCQQTSGIDEAIKSEPKLISMYDMLGRPVYNARENEITIYLYSDGSTRKVIQH